MGLFKVGTKVKLKKFPRGEKPICGWSDNPALDKKAIGTITRIGKMDDIYDDEINCGIRFPHCNFNAVLSELVLAKPLTEKELKAEKEQLKKEKLERKLRKEREAERKRRELEYQLKSRFLVGVEI